MGCLMSQTRRLDTVTTPSDMSCSIGAGPFVKLLQQRLNVYLNSCQLPTGPNVSTLVPV